MANDLRNMPPRQRSAAEKKGNPVVFLIIGIFLLATGVGFIPGIILFVIGIVGLISTKKPAETGQKAQPVQQPAAKAKKPAQMQRGPEICDNPEPHRHFEVKKPCDNPEIHSHYEDKYTPSGKRWPTEQEKRLLNMRHLYEAGLLTREEYDSEIRKLRKSGA